MMKSLVETVKVWLERHFVLLLLCSSLFFWLFLFRSYFVTNMMTLSADARFYFIHAKFFSDALARGVFPLWDPTWFGGFPNEFFLRRMGEFNPFFLVVPFMVKMGFTFLKAYLFFLFVYLVLAMTGFFLLAQRIFQDSKAASIAFLLLLFSSFPLKLFDSYLFYIFVPQVWFFMFLLSFAQKPSRFHFTGCLFSLMLIMITYVPFYFLTVFVVFLLSVILFKRKAFLRFFKSLFTFVKENCVFVFVLIVCFVLSCLPGFFYYLNSVDGDVVMPVRNAASSSQSAINVHLALIEQGGMNLMQMVRNFRSAFSLFKYGDVAIPFGFFMFFSAGLVVVFSSQLGIIFFMAAVLFLLALTDATPILAWLYQHIFFFKYFRNFGHFLWIGILPLVALLCAGFYQRLTRHKNHKFLLNAFCLIVFFAVYVILLSWLNWPVQAGHLAQGIVFAYAALFVWILLDRKENGNIFLLVLFVLIGLQAQFFSFPLKGNQNLIGHFNYAFKHRYESGYLSSPYIRIEKHIPRDKETFYILSRSFKQFYDLLPRAVYQDYMRYRFLVYDRAERLVREKEEFNTQYVRQVLSQKQNKALVFERVNEGFAARDDKKIKKKYAAIKEKRTDFEVLRYDVNRVVIKTLFTKRKFVVYNDAFHNKWRCHIDGNPAKIYQTNIAFKGFWVPPGEHQVELRFGLWIEYVFKWLMLILFLLIALGLGFSAVKQIKTGRAYLRRQDEK